ncbi:MAG: hypothetical protein KAW40_03720 [Candidatus Aenigmarchaeota archaeon]|nr:hypothetical protein [Candidatus Aenigmarchaeota archaeon]
MAKAASEIHEIGKYPAHEEKEKGNHLVRNLGIVGGIATGVAGLFLGYKALTKDNPKDTAAETQKGLYDSKKEVRIDKKNYGQEAIKDLKAGLKETKKASKGETKYGDSKGGELPEEKTYSSFTKKDFADVIEPKWKRRVGPNVDIMPEEVARVKELTTKQLETLYRKQWREYGDINVSRAIKEFLDSNNYKGPGWVVWVFIDEDPTYGYQPEIVFENKEGCLTVHNLSTLDF